MVSYLFEVSEEVLSLVALGGEPLAQVDGQPRLIHSAQHTLKSRGYASNYEDAELIVAITTCFLLSKYLEDYPPTLAGMNGQFLEVEGVFFEHRDQLHLCPYGWPLKSQTEFRQMFEYLETGSFEPLTIFERFPFIEPATGEICVKNGAHKFLTNYPGCSEEDAQKLIELAGRLTGFVVCWEGFPEESDFRNFLSYLEVNDTFVSALDHAFGPAKEAEKIVAVSPKRPRGRPSKQRLAREAYWSCFPDGHQSAGKVWKEVHLAVEEALGGKVDISTLKRAVRNGGQKG